MSLKTSITNLDTAWKRLRQQWMETQAMWDDPVQRDFEKTYWVPLEGQVPSVQRELEQLAQVIAQAQQYVK